MRRLIGVMGWMLVAFAVEAAPVVQLDGDGIESVSFDRTRLEGLPISEVEAVDHGVRGRWRGVALVELLRLAGAPLGEKLRGERLAQVVLVHAADGYLAAFTLSEFDEAYADTRPLLAWERDGQPLNDKEGPFRIVVPGEDRQGRWVRQIERIELRQLR